MIKKEYFPRLIICFAGDSGDGVQLLGNKFTDTNKETFYDFSTFADYPAEIRAPAGSLLGVSAFTIQFGSVGIAHAGDNPDILVALNPAALKTRLHTLKAGGWLVIDSGSFTEKSLKKAGYKSNPIEEKSEINTNSLLNVNISKLVQLTLANTDAKHSDVLQCRNMWVLGMLCFVYSRDLNKIIKWLNHKFSTKPEILSYNILSLKAGNKWAEQTEIIPPLPQIVEDKKKLLKSSLSRYRVISGSEGMAEGLLVGALTQRLGMMYSSYPITPASPMLHILAKIAKNHNASTIQIIQAEDEIAACCMAIGASLGGMIGVTATSGPGLDLMAESLGYAVMIEIPLVVIDVQRSGPSTGMPTKPEQSDLEMALYGRHGETPIPVLAAAFSNDAFDIAVEAVNIAVKAMTPVICLSDVTIANSSQPWEIPVSGKSKLKIRTQPPWQLPKITKPQDNNEDMVFNRSKEFMARPWLVAGTSKTTYRLGGLEKDSVTGKISYDPSNHAKMTNIRLKKMQLLAKSFPDAENNNAIKNSEYAILTWGSVSGPAKMAVEKLHDRNVPIDHLILRHLNPLPVGLKKQLSKYKVVFLPEMNSGHLARHLKSQINIDVKPLSKIEGVPFTINELYDFVMDNK